MIKINTSLFQYQKEKQALLRTHKLLMINWQDDFEQLLLKINEVREANEEPEKGNEGIKKIQSFDNLVGAVPLIETGKNVGAEKRDKTQSEKNGVQLTNGTTEVNEI